MSCASFLGAGHKIEFFGEDGMLMLHNPSADYMRGFELMHAKRSATAIEHIPVLDSVDAKYPDGRIAPVSRLAKIFFDAIETGTTASPGFAEGYRVQLLIDAARRAHQQGRWIDVAYETAKEGART
jgi:predicted dehydrogenase